MSQEKLLINIGIPFFNAERYLALAIQSALHQTYTRRKLHLVDDGNSDNSQNIVKAYEVKDGKIKIISDGKICGSPKILNELSAIANGCFYCRMESDYMTFSNRLEKQVQYLIANPIVDLVWALGKTSKLIERRFQDLKIDELNYHQKVINKMSSTDLLKRPNN